MYRPPGRRQQPGRSGTQGRGSGTIKLTRENYAEMIQRNPDNAKQIARIAQQRGWTRPPPTAAQTKTRNLQNRSAQLNIAVQEKSSAALKTQEQGLVAADNLSKNGGMMGPKGVMGSLDPKVIQEKIAGNQITAFPRSVYLTATQIARQAPEVGDAWNSTGGQHPTQGHLEAIDQQLRTAFDDMLESMPLGTFGGKPEAGEVEFYNWLKEHPIYLTPRSHEQRFPGGGPEFTERGEIIDPASPPGKRTYLGPDTGDRIRLRLKDALTNAGSVRVRTQKPKADILEPQIGAAWLRMAMYGDGKITELSTAEKTSEWMGHNFKRGSKTITGSEGRYTPVPSDVDTYIQSWLADKDRPFSGGRTNRRSEWRAREGALMPGGPSVPRTLSGSEY